jgi:hypothetical protein
MSFIAINSCAAHTRIYLETSVESGGREERDRLLLMFHGKLADFSQVFHQRRGDIDRETINPVLQRAGCN